MVVIRNRVRWMVVAAAVALAAGLSTGAARAEGLAGLERPNSWTVGTLAFGNTPYATIDVPDRVSNLHDKVRIGGSDVPGLEGLATVRPWLSLDNAPDGTVQGMSGVLIDVPFGSFVFTPSIGAGYVSRAASDTNPAIEFRSQLELGYEFSNKSRFTLGYSRITGGEGGEEREADNVFGLFYRLPFGGQ